MVGEHMTISHVPGTCFGAGDRFEQLLQLDDLTEIHLGSFTYRAHYGNFGVRHVPLDGGIGTIVAADHRNPGIAALEAQLPGLLGSVHEDDKLLRVSITSDGHEPDELPDLAQVCASANVDVLEIDLSCPYVWHDGSTLSTLGFSDDAIATVLGSVQYAIADCTPRAVEVRLPPYHDRFPVHVHRPNAALPHVHSPNLKRALRCIRHFPFVSGVVLTAGMPQVRAVDRYNRAFLETSDGLGVLDGSLLLSSTIEHLEAARVFTRDLRVIARTGITNRNTIAEVRASGASGVQIDAAALGHHRAVPC
jgi:dihydroorotate dehydrogenase